MTPEQFKKFKDSLQVVSDIKFKKVVTKQRENPDIENGFVDMLEKSEFFKGFFFEAFIEGIDYEQELRNINIQEKIGK